MNANQCMNMPKSSLQAAAKKAGIKYITLDTMQGKLKVCQELSLHQQPLFSNGGINPLVQETLKKQEKKCTTMCNK